jgi:hypothetical protein
LDQGHPDRKTNFALLANAEGNGIDAIDPPDPEVALWLESSFVE